VSSSARCRSTRGHRPEPDEQQHNAEPGHNWDPIEALGTGF
jgi:hypothetical protein